MKKSLLDTDIFSEILKGINPTIRINTARYLAEHSKLCISTITILEIVKGFQKLNQGEKISRLKSNFDQLEIFPLDAEAGELAGKIYADLEKTGLTIGRADPMIAAIAVVHGLDLVTGNTAHYKRIVDLSYRLKLSNWRDIQ